MSQGADLIADNVFALVVVHQIVVSVAVAVVVDLNDVSVDMVA